jgi:hypothetical protein
MKEGPGNGVFLLSGAAGASPDWPELESWWKERTWLDRAGDGLYPGLVAEIEAA